MKIETFVERHGITIEAKPVALAAHWTGDKEAQSWECTLKCGKREMVTSFTKGSAHRTWSLRAGVACGYDRPRTYRTNMPASAPRNAYTYDKEAFLAWSVPTPPSAAEVLDCLAMDASAMDESFEDWAADFGYDTDSRKAEAAYTACRESGFALRKLLGSADFAVLLNDVERM